MSLEYDFEKFCRKSIQKYGYEECENLFKESNFPYMILDSANDFVNPNENQLEELLSFFDEYFKTREKTISTTLLKKIVLENVGDVTGLLSKYKNVYWEYTKVGKMKFNFTYKGRR